MIVYCDARCSQKDYFNQSKCQLSSSSYKYSSIQDEAKSMLNKNEKQVYNLLNDKQQIMNCFMKYISCKNDEDYVKVRCLDMSDFDEFDKKDVKQIKDNIYKSIDNAECARELIKVICCKLNTRKRIADSIQKFLQDISKEQDDALYCNKVMSLFSVFASCDTNTSFNDIIDGKQQIKHSDICNYICAFYNKYVFNTSSSELDDALIQIDNIIRSGSVINLINANKGEYERMLQYMLHALKCLSKLYIFKGNDSVVHMRSFSKLQLRCLQLSLTDTNLYYISKEDANNIYFSQHKSTYAAIRFHELVHFLHFLMYNDRGYMFETNNICNFINTVKTKSKLTSFFGTKANNEILTVFDSKYWSNNEEFLTITGYFLIDQILYASYFNENYYNVSTRHNNNDDDNCKKLVFEKDGNIDFSNDQLSYRLFHDHREVVAEVGDGQHTTKKEENVKQQQKKKKQTIKQKPKNDKMAENIHDNFKKHGDNIYLFGTRAFAKQFVAMGKMISVDSPNEGNYLHSMILDQKGKSIRQKTINRTKNSPIRCLQPAKK